MKWFTLITIGFTVLGLALSAGAEEVTTLEVTVTSVSDRSVFLDHGRAAGITQGLRVRFIGPDLIEGIVQAVSTNNARVDLPPDVAVPPVGTKGEVEVTLAAQRDAGGTGRGPTTDGRRPNVPVHPPWTRREKSRTDDMPLLAPAFRTRPDERPAELHGRFFLHGLYSSDRSSELNSDYYVGRFGTTLNGTNLFGHGDRTLFSGEYDYRFRDVYSGDSEEMDLRLERLSYAVGGEDYAPYRLEFGRFYSIHVPEFGLMDGAEGVLQFENGMKLGAGGGMQLVALPDYEWDDDLGLHFFAQYDAPSEQHLSAVLAYQKTWHDSESDRDQLLARFNAQVFETWWLNGMTRFDIYDSDDPVKGSGIDLTECWFQARWQPKKRYGASASYTHYSWPELKRRDYAGTPEELLREGYVDRTSVRGWIKAGKAWRFTGRADYWTDYRSDGLGGELGASWDDPKSLWPAISAAVFSRQSTFTDANGFRVEARDDIDNLNLFVGYELYEYTSTSLFSGDDRSIRHTVRGGLGWTVGKWYFNLNGDYYFGDNIDAVTIGVFGQFRF